ncbi:S8 family serine peptidase [Streptomyces cocklensis]|uniref:Serine protease, subtilisin family n=1 Tax=Actinacidiphila cocklensis TaxID=887465 RepID=A0A9W4DTK9_9ACTN|nr:S8 family serine peptidase [Actinacidiphila cocklensis]MDD1063290.1 S8 family serine peptidase [Actinacidiphila cocklensis]CAG6393732.1 Serine protease, subtilisin family [Actinacidiphila cocklensis]
MRSPTRRRRLLTAMGTVLAAIAATPSIAQATTPPAGTPAAPAPTSQAAPAGTVTLVTGDRVTVTTLADGRSAATVDRPASLTGGVQTRTVGKDLYVYPAEVLPYVAAGVLDQRLFDVTALIADGYDDARTAALPLIVQYADTGARSAPAVPRGLSARRDLPAVHGKAVTEQHAGAAAFWQEVTPPAALTRARTRAAERQNSGARPRTAGAAVFGANISHIWLDGKVKATLADSTAQIGAPAVWQSGTDGKGVDVAVLDSGIDAEHPDLAGQVAASQSFVPGEDTTDHHGHGTHTASTIAGTGAASDGKEKGVAAGSRLLVGKVLGDDGYGDESWIIAGMQWAAQEQHAKVVSMSLGSTEASDGTDPMSQAVNDLSDSTGALFVIAAGNTGPGGIGSPGAATSALTVGAVDSADQLAYFSSWGPRSGDGGLKPEITAPGVDILAARSQYSAEGSGPYVTMSGTSMATPHVAGAAALVAQAHPQWTGQQIKDALVSSAHQTPDIPVTQGGSGRLDAQAAVLGEVHASATAWAGFYPWPHTSDAPATRTVTYTNTGAADVTLNLKAAATDSAGADASAAFALSAPTVTVPAGGTAQVTVTADPAKAPYGVSDGLLEATAADGTAVAHTLIGLDREEERYNLTITTADRTGTAVPGTAVVYRTGDLMPYQVEIPDSGRLTMRLPKGEYSVLMYADLPGAAGPDDLGLGVLSVPQLQLDGDRTAALDARKAHLVSAVTPQRSEDRMTRVEWNRVAGGESFNENFLLPVAYTSVWAQSTAKVTSGGFAFDTRWRKTAPLLTAAAKGAHGRAPDLAGMLVQAGSTLLPAGSSTLPVVYAGAGTTADYAGLNAKGKAVVVRYDRQADPAAQPAADAAQAAAAVAAGARLLLVAGDTAGRLSAWYGSADYESPSPIEVASLQTGQGAALIAAAARPGLTLDLTSTPTSPYVYDLVERHDDAIPAADLTYAPKKGDLARIDSRFAGKATDPGDNGRYDMQDFDRYGVGFQTVQTPGTTRTDWVTPGGRKFGWYEESANPVVEERALVTHPVKGSTTPSDWFLPVYHPRLNDSQSMPDRQGDFFVLNIPGWGDSGSGHDGFDVNLWGDVDNLHETVTLYQGDTDLGSTVYQQLAAEAPSSAPLPYRLVAETSQDGVLPSSPSTRTEWGFTSGSGYVDLPLIQLDYGVPTDLSGRAPRNTPLTLTASHLPGVTGAGTIDGATLQVSYDDGATWTALHLARHGTTWTSTAKAPRSAGHVSLRATAEDDAGNTVSQTVLRAYALK